MRIYECDPNKNTACKKTGCFINNGFCSKTSYDIYAVDPDNYEVYDADSDIKAKDVIKRFKHGLATLSEFVTAVEYCAEKHPELTMAELDKWADSE